MMKPEVTNPAFRRLFFILSLSMCWAVFGLAQPTPSISGDTVVCKGDSRFYATTFVQGHSWVWATSPGGTIIQNFGNFVEVKWNGPANSNQWILVTETDTNGVSATVQKTVKIKASDIVCNNHINVSLDQNGEAIITPDMLLEGNYNTYAGFTVVITTSWGAYLGDKVDCSHIGLQLTGKVINDCNGNTCWGTLKVEDKKPPKWQCPTDTLLVSCETEIDSLPHPFVVDNCDDSLLVSLTGITIDNSDICQGVNITRYWIATDDYENKSICVEHIRIPPDGGVLFPPDRIWECSDYNSYPHIVDATPYTGDLETTGSGIVQGVNGTYCQYTALFKDEILANCGNTFKIVRTWTVVNWCTNEIITSDSEGNDNEQIIKVVDTTPPLITANDITIGINNPGPTALHCTSTGNLPAPAVSDECGTVTVQIFTPIGEAVYNNGSDGKNGGKVPHPGLKVGTYPVIYKATDACGNIALDTITVTVTDLNAPTAICDKLTITSLDVFGHSEVFANTFDDGSTDNCCISHFLARRMDQPQADFEPSVFFDCDDEEVQVVVRVFDCFDNFGECMVTVHVQDKVAPSCIAPPDKTIKCTELPADITPAWLASQGQAGFYDNCGATLVELPVQESLDGCGGGFLLRQFIAVDSSGNISGTCSQKISVEPVSDWIIHFPPNFTGGCGDSLLADSLHIENFGCNQFAVSVSDQFFKISSDTACFKIVRTYKVINWCYYDPYREPIKVPTDPLGAWIDETFSDYHGAFEYQQIIKIHDDTPPVLSYPFSPVICSYDSLCQVGHAYVPLLIEGECSNYFEIVYHLDYGANGTFDAQGQGFIDMPLPLGKYRVRYIVQDGCGNESTIDVDFEVRDCKAPVAICSNGLIVEIMQDGNITVCASAFDDKSYDNCGGPLYFSWSEDPADSCRTFTCQQTFTEIPVTVWVTDASGNQDFCETHLVIQDNLFHCDTNVPLSGFIKTEQNKAVKDVNVMLNSDEGDLNTQTGANGFYQFQSITPGFDYSVTPSKNDDLLNGVTTFDLVLISRHILGVAKLDSPYKLIAADINNSKTITTLDLVLLRKAILYVNDNFPNNKSWRFVDKSFVFPDPTNPWATPFPEVININNLSDSVSNADFVAIKIGDVNGSATTNLDDDPLEGRSLSAWTIQSHDQAFQAGEELEMPLQMDSRQAIAGFQLGFTFDAEVLEFIDAIPAEATASEDLGFHTPSEGVILLNWYTPRSSSSKNGELIRLRFKAKRPGRLVEAIRLDPTLIAPEAYLYVADDAFETAAIQLEFISSGNSNTEDFLLTNLPNPFDNSTTIRFYLQQAGEASLYITNLSGQIVWSTSGQWSAGLHEITLDGDQLPGHGMFLCRLVTANAHKTIRMVRMTNH